jgi:hypothetical protein
MVRRQGKRKGRAALESGNDEKKKEGENSFSRVGAFGARETKHRRRDEQRLKAHTPGSFYFYFPFKTDCFELRK